MIARFSKGTARIYRSFDKRLKAPHCRSKGIITTQRIGTAAHSSFMNDNKNDNDIKNSNLPDEIDNANERYDGILIINKTTLGYGLESLRSFHEGDKVMSSKALEVTPRDSHTVQTGWDRHVLIDLPARFVNHSCDANLGIRDNKNGAYDFFALRDIREGSELLWDYEASEYEIGSFETCLCASQRCRKSLGGFKKHGDQVKSCYGEYVADYLKE